MNEESIMSNCAACTNNVKPCDMRGGKKDKTFREVIGESL